MTIIRIPITNSYDGTTVATAANSTLTKVATGTEFWTVTTSAGANFADLGILPLQLLFSQGVLEHQDYVVNAFIDTTATPGVTGLNVTPIAIAGVGGAAYPIGPARSTDPSNPNEGPRVRELHLAGGDYALSFSSSGAVGPQTLVFEFIPVERKAQIEFDGGALDGAGTGETSIATSNVQLKSDLDLTIAGAGTVRYVHSGPSKTIQRLAVVIQAGTIATAAATITWAIESGGGPVAVTASTLTLNVSDTVDDTSISLPSGANVLGEGDVLIGTIGGGNDGAGTLGAVSMQLL